MRFKGLALVVSAFAFAACGGGENNSDTAVVPDADAAAPAATGTGTTPAGPDGAAAPITGTTHEVKMVGDDKGYRFEPADLKVKAGDGVKFVMVSGGPHNVDFSQGAGAAATQLTANMPNQMAPLSGPYLSNPNEAYTVSFANVPAGSYEYICTPHAAMNMKAKITVE
jgi:plastocyanin